MTITLMVYITQHKSVLHASLLSQQDQNIAVSTLINYRFVLNYYLPVVSLKHQVQARLLLII